VEFLVEFQVDVPKGTPESEIAERERAEAASAADLAREGHLVRIWKPQVASGGGRAVGQYRADSEAQVASLSAPCRSTIGCGSQSRGSIRTPTTRREHRPAWGSYPTPA